MLKKIFNLSALVMILSLVLSTNVFAAASYPNSSTAVKAGDILVTSDTSSNGLTGHAGIVVNSTYLVEIKGAGYHPQKTAISSFFNSHRNKVRVVRYNNATAAQKAANWANKYQANYSNVSYDFDDLYQYNKSTYCSKIVWDAYHFGANVNFSTARLNLGNVTVPYWIQVATPYGLLNEGSLVLAQDSNW
ncbi:hypothetical protein G3M74_10295 [Paenibacillus polymyxa]|nr:hypothetical protein [Paenibacillus polymyxa]